MSYIKGLLVVMVKPKNAANIGHSAIVTDIRLVNLINQTKHMT